MYSRPPGDIVELFAPFPDEIKAIGEKLREIIMSSTPGIEENVYGGTKVGNAFYSIGGVDNVICGLQPQKAFVRVFFHNWERLKAAGYTVEGSGKKARHIKVSSMSSLDSINLSEMIDIIKR